MRRRDVLRTLGAGLVGGAALSGTATAHPPTATPTGTTPTGTPAQSTPVARPDDYGPLGSVTLPRATEAVVNDDGTTAFVAVTDGFATVDVSDPANPTVLAERRNLLADREDGPMEAVHDVKVDGDRLAVVAPANPRDGVPYAAALYDVSDPANPDRTLVYETDFFNHNCFVRDGVLYLCGNDGQRNALVTVDAESGERLGAWSVVSRNDRWQEVRFGHWPLHDVYVQGGVAYLAHWDAGTYLVDVSDPANPTLLAQVRGRPPETFLNMSREESSAGVIEPPGNDHYVTVDESGDLMGIGVESWDAPPLDGTGGPGGIHLFDVSDPTAAEKLAFVAPPPTDDETFEGTWTTSHNFEIRDDKLYSSWYQGGVRVHDVRDPANPEELRAWRDSAATSFWTAQQGVDGEFFVASSRMDPGREQPKAGAALYTFPDVAGSTPTPTATQSPSPSPTQDETGPGFGVLGALGALGVAAWRRL